MIFVWRGWGPLAVVCLFPALLSCVLLIDVHILAAFGASGACLVGGGLICWFFGRKWNRGSGYHSIYGIPLEVCGLVFLVFGGMQILFLSVAGTVNLVKWLLA